MIDPNNITNYNLNEHGLQEIILFWICVAGKTAKTIAKALDNLLKEIGAKKELPFEAITKISEKELALKLKNNGIGCYTLKAKAIKEVAESGFNLRTCTANDLEKIYGIGMKTSRCFLIHSRKEVKYAGIDTHLLKFLRSKGHDVPRSTPNTKKQYLKLEQLILDYAKAANKTVAEFDLDVWKTYSR